MSYPEITPSISVTAYKQSGHSSRYTSCSSVRPAQQTCWWTSRGLTGTPRRQSLSGAPCDTDGGPPHRSGRWPCAESVVRRLWIRFEWFPERAKTLLQIKHYLKVHELHQLGDFRLQNLHCLLIDLHSIGLLVAFHLQHETQTTHLLQRMFVSDTVRKWRKRTDYLWYCTRAAPPGVEHDRILLPLLQHFILKQQQNMCYSKSLKYK